MKRELSDTLHLGWGRNKEQLGCGNFVNWYSLNSKEMAGLCLSLKKLLSISVTEVKKDWLVKRSTWWIPLCRMAAKQSDEST